MGLEEDGSRGYLNRNILGMSFTSLLADVSTESAYAILPFYVTVILGFGKDVLGLIEGAGEFTASLFKLFSGWIADKVRKYKLLAVLGYGLSAIAKPILAFTSHWIQVLTIKAIDRVGKGLRTSPRDVLLSMSASRKVRGRAFGFHRSMDTVGAVLGPFTAFLLLPLVGYRGVFLVCFIPGFIAVLILWLLVVEPRTPPPPSTRRGQAGVGEKAIPRVFWVFLLALGLTGLAGYTHAFLLIRATEIGWSRANAIILLSLANIVYASTAYPVGFLGDKMGYPRLYPAVFIIQAVGALLVVYTAGYYWGLLYFIVYGLYHGFNDTLMRVLTSYYVPVDARARAYGYMHGTYGFSVLAGYYIVGLLYERINAQTAFMYTAVIALIGLAVSMYLALRYKQ